MKITYLLNEFETTAGEMVAVYVGDRIDFIFSSGNYPIKSVEWDVFHTYAVNCGELNTAVQRYINDNF